MTEPKSITGLLEASKCVYLATDEAVADDISARLLWAANQLAMRPSREEVAKVLMKLHYGRDCWDVVSDQNKEKWLSWADKVLSLFP